jgi:hypothetical protein
MREFAGPLHDCIDDTYRSSAPSDAVYGAGGGGRAMNMQPQSGQDAFLSATQRTLLGTGTEPLAKLSQDRARLREAVAAVRALADDAAARRLDKLMRQLDTFEPSVTMIGQIKSGKTSLVNAFVGQPELLPADVNPWTSVVTSLHLHPETKGFKNTASFRFFDEDEWDRLVSGGGRIGELASRAGADDELAKIKRQVEEMREKSRRRLGRKFELLLGQQRDYGYFDKELIERYVCLGDDFDDDEDDDETGEDQGQFADITKSADLNLERLSLPMRLCVRDTPGVNDTFMMREQITIRAIRDSRMCVVVLSAHQALSSTDLALIRLVSQVKTRDVVIFVNRIDELSDPENEVPQIAHSIRETLKRHKGPEQAEVIFGSALWASHALGGARDRLPPSSARALENWAAACNEAFPVPSEPAARAWKLSGVPALQAALGREIARGVGQALLQRVAVSALNLAHGVAAAARIGASDGASSAAPSLAAEEATRLLEAILREETERFAASFDSLLEDYAERLGRVQASFLERATHSLIVHLERNGETEPWTYDPAGLRVLLNSSHKVLARKTQAIFGDAVERVAGRFGALYRDALGLGPNDIPVATPRPPAIPAPVALGQTIALDLQGNWWHRWWKQRRGYRAYAENYYDLIKAETNPVIEDLRDDLARGVKATAIETFENFLAEQKSVFASLQQVQDGSPDARAALLARTGSVDRREALGEAIRVLIEVADT